MYDDMVLSNLNMVNEQNLKDFLEVGNISQGAFDKAMAIKEAQKKEQEQKNNNGNGGGENA